MKRRGGIAVAMAVVLSGLALLACDLTGAGSATDTPIPPPSSTPPLIPVLPTSTITPVPSPTPTLVLPTATLTPTAPIILAIAGPDHKIGLVTFDGKKLPLSQAPGNLYALATLSTGASATSHAYSIGPQGVKELSFVNNSSDGFASFTGPSAPQGEVAWDHWDSSTTSGPIKSDIYIANVDGSGLHSVQQLSSDHVLHVVRFSPDGQRLYYSQEPLGLGGYIPFSGVSSNLWALDLAGGKSTQLVPDAAAGVICLDDLASDESLIALSCKKDVISVLDTSTGGIGLISPPANVTDWSIHGDTRISPDQSRVAYSLARGDPNNEQGWVAVSDGLTGTSRLVATAAAGDYYSVKGWLDNTTLVLQSWSTAPGVWVVQADGSDLRRLADGIFLGGG